MRIVVLGAGAIGAYVGAALDRGGAEVTLIARGAHLAAMAEHGVRVISPRGDFAARPPVTDDLGAVVPARPGERGPRRADRPVDRPRAQRRLRGLADQIWLKLIGNVAFNPVSALTRATLGELGRVPEMMDLLRAIFGECALVADRLGIRFPVSLDRRLEAGIAVGDHETSMLADLRAGKPLEVGCLTGAVVELADRFDIDVPNVRAIHACVTLLDHLNRA